MTMQQLKNEIRQLKESLKLGTSQYHVIIYDYHLHKGDKIPLKSFLIIDGIDVTILNNVEKKLMISGADTLLYLPEKDPLPIAE